MKTMNTKLRGNSKRVTRYAMLLIIYLIENQLNIAYF